MERVQPPKRGRRTRFDRGRIDGVFVIAGKRTYRLLEMAEDAERTPGGRLRSDQQLMTYLLKRWDHKRGEIEAELKAQDPPGRRMSDVFKTWLSRQEQKGLDEQTLSIQRLCRDYYLELAGDHPIALLSGEPPRLHYDVEKSDLFTEGLLGRGLGPARVNTYLGRLASALRFAYRRGWIDREPEIERVKERRQPPRVPNSEHIKALRKRLVELSRDAVNGRQRYQYRQQRLLFYMLLFTGMRPMEARLLPCEHVDVDRRAILLVKTKTGRQRVVRIGRFLAGKLRAHFAANPGQRLVFEDRTEIGVPAWAHTAAMGTAMRRHMKEVGIKGAFKGLYGYRAGFSTAGLNNVGVKAESMTAQMGHSDLQTTLDHYVAGMNDAQLLMVDDMERGFFQPLFDRKMIENSEKAQGTGV